MPPAEGAALDEGPYRMEFGKHSKLTVREVHDKDPGYLPHMLATSRGILWKQYPGLRAALQTEGLLESVEEGLRRVATGGIVEWEVVKEPSACASSVPLPSPLPTFPALVCFPCTACLLDPAVAGSAGQLRLAR